jgi:FG-GAP-like repeat/Secretion system C-terminal sorting domain
MKKLLILLLLSPLLSFGQIPILSFAKNVFNYDKSFDSLATSKNYWKFVNQYYNFSDLNKDGKLDIVMSTYTDKTQSGTLNVFYNQSTANQYIFNNKHNFFYRGQGINIEVGDFNNDGKLDILAPTQNYHGLESNKPIEYYPTPSNSANNGQTPDKLFIQNEKGFAEFTQPDTLATLSGKFIDIDGDGTPEWISSNQTIPSHYYNGNLNRLWVYKFKNNTLERSFMLEAEISEDRLYLGSLDVLEDNKYFYLPYTKYSNTLINNRQVPLVQYVFKYKKGQTKYVVGVDCDTVSRIPFSILSNNGLNYYYSINNEDGIKIIDIDNDGNLETIVMRYTNYLSGDKQWVTGDPPISILQVFDKLGNDITDKFIEKPLQSDPQNYYSTNGFELTDINGDGLKDILTKGNWGWSFDSRNPIARDKKYILLNTGKFFKGYYLDLKSDANLKDYEGWGIPIALNPGKPKSILVVSLANGTIGQSNVHILDLDFSQFKFPCETNKPNITIAENINFCSSSDSLVLKSGALAGLSVKWYSGNTLIGSNSDLTVKSSGTYKVNVTNLGGCVNEKNIVVNKITNPDTPTITTTTPLIFCSGQNVVLTSNGTNNQWYLNGNAIANATAATFTANAAGAYKVKAINGDCSSPLSATSTVVVNPIPPTPSITQESNGGLTSSASDGNQWYFNDVKIDNATQKTINPTKSGNYTVKVTTPCASEVSKPYNLVVTANEETILGQVQLSPNPFTNQFKVSFPVEFGKTAQVKIVDMSGNVHFKKASVSDGEVIELGSLNGGNYVLHLNSNDNANLKTIKISKIQ